MVKILASLKSFWLFWFVETEPVKYVSPVNYGHEDAHIWEPNYKDPKL